MVQAAPAHRGEQQDDEAPTHAQDVSCLAMGLRSMQTVLELESIGARAPSTLTRLCLHANSITSLDGLQVLTSLRELLVSCNPLSTTGHSLSALAHLRLFDATSCHLQNADGFASLTNLQHLVRTCVHMLYDWHDAWNRNDMSQTLGCAAASWTQPDSEP
jgi:hypothetical protein